MPATTKGVWKLQDVRNAVLTGEWINYNTCRDGGTLWAWGCGVCGALGNGSTSDQSSPVQIPGTSWYCVTGGRCTSFAIKADGTLWSWGNNLMGQLGLNFLTPSTRNSPNQIPGSEWETVSAFLVAAAVKRDGTLWTWGYENFGSLGNNSVLHRSSPVQIPGTQWVEASAGGDDQTYARKSDGTLWGWGKDTYLPQLTPGHRSSPIQIPGTSWNDICVKKDVHHARKTDGTLWGWGASGGGIGGGATGVRSSPVQIPGDTWCHVSNGKNIMGAIKTDGTMWQSGYQDFANGQFLGINSLIHRSSPVQVPGTSWCTSVMAYCENASGAIKTDGTLWTWGMGTNGSLGIDCLLHRSSPVQIPGTSWTGINNGFAHMLALKSP